MKLAELAALVGAMDLDPLESTHIISPGYEHLAKLTERIIGGRARCVGMIPIPWADGIAAAMNAIPQLLAVCEAAAAAVDVWGSHAEDSDEWGSLNKLRAALRDLETK